MSAPVTLRIHSRSRVQTIDITEEVRRAVREGGVREGICVVFVGHTTAGITVNENADPDVAADMEGALAGIVPRSGRYRHAEGNSDSHLKASLVGSSVTLVVSGGEPLLGRWQGVHFCEYDGPRSRTVHVKCVAG